MNNLAVVLPPNTNAGSAEIPCRKRGTKGKLHLNSSAPWFVKVQTTICHCRQWEKEENGMFQPQN
jgi:hypothetical protein